MSPWWTDTLSQEVMVDTDMCPIVALEANPGTRGSTSAPPYGATKGNFLYYYYTWLLTSVRDSQQPNPQVSFGSCMCPVLTSCHLP